MRAVFTWRRGHLHVRRIGAGLLFGQRKRGQLFAVHQAREPFRLLLLGAEQQKGANADRVVRIRENGRRRIAFADFLENLAVLHLGKPTAAHLFRCRHAEHARLAESVDHPPWNVLRRVDLTRIKFLVEESDHFRACGIEIALLRG